eukprot:scaffold49490_cov91-Phaeocystis_antarctica.AAC.3
MACVRPSIVPFLYSKRAAATRSPRSHYGQSIVLWLRLLSEYLVNIGSGRRAARKRVTGGRWRSEPAVEPPLTKRCRCVNERTEMEQVYLGSQVDLVPPSLKIICSRRLIGLLPAVSANTI